jgi:molecular chaperone DnaJ
MFGDFMGQRRGGGPARGADLRYNMEITLEEAFAGKDAQIQVGASQRCETCDGSGAEPGTKPITCPTCQGAGKVRAQQGFFTIERPCSTCQGAGRVIEKPCHTCHGAGKVRKEKTLSVTIPPGVEEGTRIRLGGEGEAGARGAPAGDLYIFLSIAAHRLFQRDGANVFCRVPLPLTTAALGGVIEVPTIEGARARITIPAGTQTGHQFRLRAKGMSILRSNQRGDMYVETAVETPVNLTKRQEELLREFEREGEPTKTNPQSEGFFAKVRELWEDLRD